MYTKEELKSHKIKGSYPNDFLIKVLQDFYKEHGRSPKLQEFKTCNGFPSYDSYQRRFGNWNNALKIAGLSINQYRDLNLVGNEICSNCGGDKGIYTWYFNKDGNRICHGCYMKHDYKYGNLDKNSTMGTAFITRKIVFKKFNLDFKYDNNILNFSIPYDIYDKNKYGKIKIISSSLRNNKDSSFWSFKIKKPKLVDFYILVGYTINKKNIKHVWIISSKSQILKNSKTINITDSRRGLSRVKEFEVNANSYNKIYHSMSIDECPILRKD